jgi:hypothetical protein
LAKALNPFSISPTMFCHSATGSLLLSAIGVLQRDRDNDAHDRATWRQENGVKKSTGGFRETVKQPE